VVEGKILEGIWVMSNVLILGNDVESPERALFVESKMLEQIWIFRDMLLLEDMVRVEVDLLSWGIGEGA